MKPRILVVEDDATSRITLAHLLQHAGYDVTQAADGEAAIDILEKEPFDVVVTDIVMGTVDGIEVLHTARLQPGAPRVILLTGHGTLDTAVIAVRAGAHDYLLKPASKENLLDSVARAVQAQRDDESLRKAATMIKHIFDRRQPDEPGGKAEAAPVHTAGAQPPLQLGDLVIGATRHEVLFKGQPVALTPIEYALLRFLAETPGETRTYQEIVLCTHGFEADDGDAQMLVRQHIRNLRKKLDPRYLMNDRGMGYRLITPDSYPEGSARITP